MRTKMLDCWIMPLYTSQKTVKSLTPASLPLHISSVVTLIMDISFLNSKLVAMLNYSNHFLFCFMMI